jgi:hypothetical protein
MFIITNMAHTPSPANNSCLLAKKNESSNLYEAHTALALYTIMSPIVSNERVNTIKMKSGVVFLVDNVAHL